MMVLIGLGNPGLKYQNNRHNVGKLFIDYLVNQLPSRRVNELKERNKTIIKVFENDNFILVKTETFMNLSGKAVKKFIENWNLPVRQIGGKIENLYIIHDDLDIPLGKFKIQFAQGPKLHNGIKSIEETLKTKSFWRIRIGVDNRKKESWIDGETYVLQDFLPEEKEVLITQVFPEIKKKLKVC